MVGHRRARCREWIGPITTDTPHRGKRPFRGESAAASVAQVGGPPPVHPMSEPRNLATVFRSFAARHGVDPGAAQPSAGVPLMLRFYVEHRVDGCDTGAGQDMLLFQWDTYDWGHGRHFELDITRQVILPEEEDDDAIWQLHLTYRFAPTLELAALGAGNRWCESPEGVEAFTNLVRSSSAFAAVADRRPLAADVVFECAG